MVMVGSAGAVDDKVIYIGGRPKTHTYNGNNSYNIYLVKINFLKAT